MTCLFVFILGFAIGWLVFKPMQWVTDIYEWLKQRKTGP